MKNAAGRRPSTPGTFLEYENLPSTHMYDGTTVPPLTTRLPDTKKKRRDANAVTHSSPAPTAPRQPKVDEYSSAMLWHPTLSRSCLARMRQLPLVRKRHSGQHPMRRSNELEYLQGTWVFQDLRRGPQFTKEETKPSAHWITTVHRVREVVSRAYPDADAHPQTGRHHGAMLSTPKDACHPKRSKMH